MTATALWMFAHKALAPELHRDPANFARLLDDDTTAPRFLEHMWSWATEVVGASAAARPPLSCRIDRPRPGLTVVELTFRDVRVTGEPYFIHCFVREPDPDGGGAYSRVFLLEHNAYASELAGKPTALVCESKADGTHTNWPGSSRR